MVTIDENGFGECDECGLTGISLPSQHECPIQTTQNSETSSVPLDLLVSCLLKKWKDKEAILEIELQVGRDGADDHTYAHGRMDKLTECIEELEEAISS